MTRPELPLCSLDSAVHFGHYAPVPWPKDFLLCCVCGQMESPPEPQNYVELQLAFPAHDGEMRQWFGAHASCLTKVTAPGFNVESPFD